MARSTAWRIATAAAALTLVGTGPAFAQRVLISTTVPFVSPLRTQVLNLGTGVTEFDQPAAISPGPTVFTADGRFALLRITPASGAPFLQLYDVAARTLSPVSIDFTPLAAHPRDLAFFGRTGTAATRLDLGGLRTLVDCAPAALQALDISVAGDRVAALCDTGALMIADTATGVAVRTFPVGGGGTALTAHFTSAGDAVVVSRALPPALSQVAVVDIASGQDTSTADYPNPVLPSDATPGCRLRAVSATRTVGVVACRWFFPRAGPVGLSFEVFETRRVTLPALSWGPLLGVRYAASEVQLDPVGATMFATSSTFRGGASVQLVDVTSGAALAEAAVAGSGMAVTFAPLAPSALAAQVTGATVQLDWQLPADSPAVTGYVLEAGSASGLANLATVTLGPATSLTIPGVPRGRYYVRVRGVNVTGRGAPSSEVVLDVP